MAQRADLGKALEFLRVLGAHNNRPWFEAHKSVYLEATAMFEAFVAELIARISEFDDLAGVQPRECIMRIYRDVRFSKDKTPYKSGFGAFIGAAGKKTRGFPYHVHVEPGGMSMAAGGLYESTPAQLSRFRSVVADDAKPFRAIVGAKPFRSLFGEKLLGDEVTTSPRGYAPDHPAIDILRKKQIYALTRFTDAEVTAASFAENVARAFRTMKPLLSYLEKAAGTG